VKTLDIIIRHCAENNLTLVDYDLVFNTLNIPTIPTLAGDIKNVLKETRVIRMSSLRGTGKTFWAINKVLNPENKAKLFIDNPPALRRWSLVITEYNRDVKECFLNTVIRSENFLSGIKDIDLLIIDDASYIPFLVEQIFEVIARNIEHGNLVLNDNFRIVLLG